jgi:uncharacterized membrane protein YphA (DoxX/SURF4 family)
MRKVADASMKPGTIAYWVTTVLAGLAFVVPGVGNLLRVPHTAHDMAHLGYPPYFLTVRSAG